jgi:hypothetical protein
VKGSTRSITSRLSRALRGGPRKPLQPLAIRREIGDQHGEGFALHSLGAAFEQLGLLDDAASACTRSLEARREIGDRRSEADALYRLGKEQ